LPGLSAFCILHSTFDPGWLWWSLGVALVKPWGGFDVALGSQWGAYQLAINTLRGGFDVALNWLWGGFARPCSFQVSAFRFHPSSLTQPFAFAPP